MKLESVEEKDILQVNATMIAGAFIFLTLLISTGEKTFLNQAATIAYSVIIPFTISSIGVIFAYWNRSNNSRKGFINISLGFMVLGFLALIAFTLVSVVPKLS
jgi:hypothetical protein